MPLHQRCLQIPHREKQQLRFLFLAKHALGDGTPDREDGTHSTYHHELLSTLREIGLQVVASDSFRSLYDQAGYDFVISLYNRAGFRNSEMLAPLLTEQLRLPYLGGSAIVRGVTDDKHWMKRIAQSLCIRTPSWRYYPIGGLDTSPPAFRYRSLMVKPNASSASWGILHTDQWSSAWRHVQSLHAQGHDVIVESYIDGFDVADPVVGSVRPWFLPIIAYRNEGPLRTYEQKRDLIKSTTVHEPLPQDALFQRIRAASERIVTEIWPFDHGRFEYRVEHGTGKLYFIEANLNCNLWSKKTISAAARQIGVSHAELVETIVCHSLLRQGLIADAAVLAA